jgi:crotonobetainyl-CoA:carnitine CoA-transferase CaiB-like acyl-CoA transferase
MIAGWHDLRDSKPVPIASFTGEVQRVDRLRSRTAGGWFNRLNAAGVPCGPSHTIEEGITFAQHIGLDPVVEGGEGKGVVPMIRHPISFSRTPPRHTLPLAALSQDNEQVRA